MVLYGSVLGLRIDCHCERAEDGKIMAAKTNFDFENQQKFENRVIVLAAPQIGKTGTYLAVSCF